MNLPAKVANSTTVTVKLPCSTGVADNHPGVIFRVAPGISWVAYAKDAETLNIILGRALDLGMVYQ